MAAVQDSGAPFAVEIRGVTKRFGSVTALDAVSLGIRQGEFFSLLGPSGCGKTTLLRMIGGFEQPSEGDLLIDGASVLGQPPYLRSTNMIFQHLALFPHMSVFDNIAFGLEMAGKPKPYIRTRVGQALELVRLPGLEGRMIDQLSGGQKQRVAMARALVNDPSVLLLDEPLGALDLQLRIQMTVELRRLHEQLKNTFIFVTHDQGEALTMSDRIAVMSQGRIQQVGTPEEIYERPRTRFVAGFIGHANILEGRVVEQQGTRHVVDCAGIRVACNGDAPLPEGGSASLALRYEKVLVSRAEPPTGTAVAPATIIRRTYTGAVVQIEASLASGAVMTADVPTAQLDPAITVGSPVFLSWSDSSAILLSD